jgi:hypothetical protein
MLLSHCADTLLVSFSCHLLRQFVYFFANMSKRRKINDGFPELSRYDSNDSLRQDAESSELTVTSKWKPKQNRFWKLVTRFSSKEAAQIFVTLTEKGFQPRNIIQISNFLQQLKKNTFGPTSAWVN